jgi:hypothetical protein
MPQSIEIEATISNGHFPAKERLRLSDAMRRMEGRRVAVKLYEPEAHSSNPQRRYYFSVIVQRYLEAFREAGNVMDKDEMHLWLKQEVGKLWKEVLSPDATRSRVLRSYRDLSTKEAEDYHTLCRARGAELGIDIPEPNEGI